MLSTSISSVMSEEVLESDQQIETVDESESEKKQPTIVFERGIFYGRIEAINYADFSISVRVVPEEFPSEEERHTGRKTFYFDRQSKIRLVRELLSFNHLQLNQKIAVRYFAENGVSVIDELYIVQGRYEPFRYKFRRQRR